MVTIDGKRIVFSTTFLVPNDREALIDAMFEGSVLKLSVTFRSGIAGEERSGTWASADGIVRFTFSGWNNPLGTCTVEPTKFGDLGTKRMFFQLSQHYIGEQNFANLFILVGD